MNAVQEMSDALDGQARLYSGSKLNYQVCSDTESFDDDEVKQG